MAIDYPTWRAGIYPDDLPFVEHVARVGADGKFQFQIDDTQGVTYAIEMSDDLQT